MASLWQYILFQHVPKHNGTQKPLPVSGEVAEALRYVAARSINKPSREVVRRAAVVTGCDISHYREMLDAVAAYQTQYPGRKLIFYDLGLKDPEKREVIWFMISLFIQLENYIVRQLAD